MSGIEKRLHKISPLFLLWENIKKLVFPALVAIVGTRSSSWEFYALGAAALTSVISMVQYRFYRYWLEDTQIRVKEGIIFRNQRQVKYDKIQNLNLIQGPLHRLLGVVKVQLESASGGKPEAVINVIDMQAVNELRKRILQEEVSVSSEESKIKTPPSILKLPFSEIVRYGIISNRGLVAVAIFFGFMGQFFDSDNPNNFRSWIRSSVNLLEDTVTSIVPETSSLATLFYTLVFILMAIIVLWILSIIMALFKFYGFKLTKNQGKLAATMGLLTRLQATIPMSRVQTITVHNSWLHKVFKRIGITVETAGGVNSEKQGVTMKQIAPVLATQDKSHFLDEIQPDQDWHKIVWQALDARAWRRKFKPVALIGLLIGLTLLTHSYLSYGIYATLVIVLSVWYAKAYIRTAGYHLSEDLAAFKSGVIFHKETYVRLPKVQTVRLKETLFDRRHNMAKLELDTAGATMGAHHIDIPYLSYNQAQDLYGKISRKIENSAFEW